MCVINDIYIYYILDYTNIFHVVYILSVYSRFSDRVGLPLHNIRSPSHSVMDIFLSISSSVISASTLSNHVLLGLPTGLLPSTLYYIHFFIQSSSPFLITCPYHLSLPLLMTVVIGSTPTILLNSSFVLLSFMEIPHIHIIIRISALSNLPSCFHKSLKK